MNSTLTECPKENLNLFTLLRERKTMWSAGVTSFGIQDLQHSSNQHPGNQPFNIE